MSNTNIPAKNNKPAGAVKGISAYEPMEKESRDRTRRATARGMRRLVLDRGS